MGAKRIEPPAPIWTHRGIMKVFFFVDDDQVRHSQPVGYIDYPQEFPCEPRIVCQAYNNGNRPIGDAYTYEPTGDNGKGAWETFNPAVHTIPTTKNTTPVVEGTPPPVEEVTELSGDVAPMSVVPPDTHPVEEGRPPTGVAHKRSKKHVK